MGHREFIYLVPAPDIIFILTNYKFYNFAQSINLIILLSSAESAL
jgi:hypothetical protein